MRVQPQGACRFGIARGYVEKQALQAGGFDLGPIHVYNVESRARALCLKKAIDKFGQFCVAVAAPLGKHFGPVPVSNFVAVLIQETPCFLRERGAP